MASRTADPWKDLAVIDSRAPRFNQAVVATLSLVALATGYYAGGKLFNRRTCPTLAVNSKDSAA